MTDGINVDGFNWIWITEVDLLGAEGHLLKTGYVCYLFDGIFVTQAAIWPRTHVYVGWKVVTFGLQSGTVSDVEVEAPEDRWTIFCRKDVHYVVSSCIYIHTNLLTYKRECTVGVWGGRQSPRQH